MSGNGVSRTLRMVATAAAAFFGGTFAIGFLTSSISGRLTLNRRKKYGKICGACKGIGYYPCKLCKTNGVIKWSSLYDPVYINPCVCPTCDGSRVQRCLNCLGYGFVEQPNLAGMNLITSGELWSDRRLIKFGRNHNLCKVQPFSYDNKETSYREPQERKIRSLKHG